jgi:hypothetical protein
MTTLLSGSALGGLASPSFNPAASNNGVGFADIFMRGGKLDIDLLAKGLGQLAGKDPAYASQIFNSLSPQYSQLSVREQGTFGRLLKTEIANATPDKGKNQQSDAGEITLIKTQYGTFKTSKDGTLTTDKFRSQPMSTPEFKLWKDVHDGLMRNKDPEMGTSAAEDIATRWIFYSEGKISIDQISTMNQLLGGSKATEKALAEYSGQGIPLTATFELPQHSPLRYFTAVKAAEIRLNAALNVQSRAAANPATSAGQLRVGAAIVQNARAGVDIAQQNFELSKSTAGRAQLEFQYQNSPEVREANAKVVADREVSKLLAIAFAGPVIGAGAALLPEALALYRAGKFIQATLTGLAGTEQVTGGLNTLRTGGESQTGIAGGLINAATSTRAGDTVSILIQLSPEAFGLIAMGKAGMTVYPNKAAALREAEALDDAAFRAGQIKERAPAGTEREILQTPQVKAQLARDAEAKALAEAAEAEAKANEIVVTAKVRPQKRERIELTGGSKGSWNKELNGPLKPNTDYVVNGNIYKTDKLGRVEKVEAELRWSKADRNEYQQLQAGGKDRLADDQGGHLIASIFNGPGEAINLKAMNGSFNQTEFRNLERTLETALQNGKKVEVKIDVIHQGDSLRPDKFIVKYTIGGVPDLLEFFNKIGG